MSDHLPVRPQDIQANAAQFGLSLDDKRAREIVAAVAPVLLRVRSLPLSDDTPHGAYEDALLAWWHHE